jgi:hypothetical protein
MKDATDSPTKSRLPSKKIILLIAVTVVITLIVSSIIAIWLGNIRNLSIPSTGRIITLGVEAYWDKDLENGIETFDWGTIWPGMSKDVTLYLRSTSNIETTLTLETTNWVFNNSQNSIVAGPSDSTPHMNLIWNYNETAVHPGETMQLTLTLSVDDSSDFIEFLIANDVKQFGVDIIIRTSEYAD